MPQLLVVSSFTSQPVALSPSQSANPDTHWRPHTALLQVGSALLLGLHTTPHAPQLSTVSIGVSQPFDGS